MWNKKVDDFATPFDAPDITPSTQYMGRNILANSSINSTGYKQYQQNEQFYQQNYSSYSAPYAPTQRTPVAPTFTNSEQSHNYATPVTSFHGVLTPGLFNSTVPASVPVSPCTQSWRDTSTTLSSNWPVGREQREHSNTWMNSHSSSMVRTSSAQNSTLTASEMFNAQLAMIMTGNDLLDRELPPNTEMSAPLHIPGFEDNAESDDGWQNTVPTTSNPIFSFLGADQQQSMASNDNQRQLHTTGNQVLSRVPINTNLTSLGSSASDKHSETWRASANGIFDRSEEPIVSSTPLIAKFIDHEPEQAILTSDMRAMITLPQDNDNAVVDEKKQHRSPEKIKTSSPVEPREKPSRSSQLPFGTMFRGIVDNENKSRSANKCGKIFKSCQPTVLLYKTELHIDLETVGRQSKQYHKILLDPGQVVLRRLPSAVIDAAHKCLPIRKELQNMIDGVEPVRPKPPVTKKHNLEWQVVLSDSDDGSDNRLSQSKKPKQCTRRDSTSNDSMTMPQENSLNFLPKTDMSKFRIAKKKIVPTNAKKVKPTPVINSFDIDSVLGIMISRTKQESYKKENKSEKEKPTTACENVTSVLRPISSASFAQNTHGIQSKDQSIIAGPMQRLAQQRKLNKDPYGGYLRAPPRKRCRSNQAKVTPEPSTSTAETNPPSETKGGDTDTSAIMEKNRSINDFAALFGELPFDEDEDAMKIATAMATPPPPEPEPHIVCSVDIEKMMMNIDLILHKLKKIADPNAKPSEGLSGLNVTTDEQIEMLQKFLSHEAAVLRDENRLMTEEHLLAIMLKYDQLLHQTKVATPLEIFKELATIVRVACNDTEANKDKNLDPPLDKYREFINYDNMAANRQATTSTATSSEFVSEDVEDYDDDNEIAQSVKQVHMILQLLLNKPDSVLRNDLSKRSKAEKLLPLVVKMYNLIKQDENNIGSIKDSLKPITEFVVQAALDSGISLD